MFTDKREVFRPPLEVLDLPFLHELYAIPCNFSSKLAIVVSLIFHVEAISLSWKNSIVKQEQHHIRRNKYQIIQHTYNHTHKQQRTNTYGRTNFPTNKKLTDVKLLSVSCPNANELAFPAWVFSYLFIFIVWDFKWEGIVHAGNTTYTADKTEVHVSV